MLSVAAETLYSSKLCMFLAPSLPPKTKTAGCKDITSSHLSPARLLVCLQRVDNEASATLVDTYLGEAACGASIPMQRRVSGIIKEVVRSKEVFDHLREEVQIQGKHIIPPPKRHCFHALVKMLY